MNMARPLCIMQVGCCLNWTAHINQFKSGAAVFDLHGTILDGMSTCRAIHE